MKEAIIAKLASQCEELYSEALKQMKQTNVASVWEREWTTKVHGKQQAYHAVAQYYQSRVCNSKKAIGEEIARLQVIYSYHSILACCNNPVLYLGCD